MIVLGIETSGLEGSIALIQDSFCLEERTLNASGRRHAQSLVLEIREILSERGLTASEIDAIAVSQGPGSFTGLRVGMVCAKTFAYATGCRFVAVDTFAAIAANLPETATRALIIEDAQRDDLFVGEYQRDVSEDWLPCRPIQIQAVEQFLLETTDWSDHVTGPGLKKLDATPTSPNWLPQPEYCKPRALTIARIGLRSLLNPAKEMDDQRDFWKATPFYLRKSAAEEKRASS